MRQRLNVSQKRLGMAAGVSQPTIGRWIRGEASADADAIRLIAEAFDVDAAWILSGNGVEPSGDGAARSHSGVDVPMLAARLGAGPGDLAEDSVDGVFPLQLEAAQEFGYPRVKLYAAKVRGNSMEDELSDGDIVIVARDPSARDGTCVVAEDGEVIVKGVQRAPGGRIRIVSRNPEYQPYELGPEADVRMIGRVVMCVRKR